MDFADLKTKSEAELKELLKTQRQELQDLSFQAHNRQLKQVHKIDLIKKTVARISMLLKQTTKKK